MFDKNYIAICDAALAELYKAHREHLNMAIMQLSDVQEDETASRVADAEKALSILTEHVKAMKADYIKHWKLRDDNVLDESACDEPKSG